MNRFSVLLQIPQPSTPTNMINDMYSNSPVLAMPPADRLSPQFYKTNMQYVKLSPPRRTFHGHKNGIIGSTPLVHVMPSCTTSSIEEEKIKEIEELTRGISGLYAEGPDARKRGLNGRTITQRRRLNVWSTSTRGGSGMFGGLFRKPGRFKIRTLILEGTTKEEHK
ncbi:hypothetical protein I3843_09G009200 [Carya illinoinensis]|uniref:Uncharacterized protein n=1 Tax=Carya illinoinensis TaxID=32201 RepID=A0A921ZXH8_CARIL|nr:hypothetical protein I3842_Q116900 [Carya illinoinensis]KAG7961315.1 hypothetical protein I3843_09G009200 [Carya illinoinensis]